MLLLIIVPLFYNIIKAILNPFGHIPNLKDIENVYRFIDKVKKEDSKYNIITNDDIHTIRRRFEPLHFYKIVEKVLS